MSTLLVYKSSENKNHRWTRRLQIWPFIWGTVTVSVVFQGSTPRSRSHSNTLYQWYYKISDLWTSLKNNNMMLATTTHRWTTETVPEFRFSIILRTEWCSHYTCTVVCVFSSGWSFERVLWIRCKMSSRLLMFNDRRSTENTCNKREL